jgi:S-disulfanyl-L-cysteine oxidoreductase SoxD
MTMKKTTVMIAGAAVVWICAICYALADDETVWNGVYNAAQVKRGEALSITHCVICHGEQLLGNEAPGLVGPDFLASWTTQTVGDLFDRVKKTMPEDHPGRLSDQEDADVVAYILSLNGFPAGEKELPTDISVLNRIRITGKADTPR